MLYDDKKKKLIVLFKLLLTIFLVLILTSSYNSITILNCQNIIVCLYLIILVNDKYVKVLLFVFLVILLLSAVKIGENLVVEEEKEDEIKFKYSIFFLESNYLRRELTTKEMCAIESAAKTNPKAAVKLYTFSAKLNRNALNLLRLYPNLRIIDFEPEKIFNDTPLLNWWQTGAVLRSPYSFSHLTDAFRMTMMLKYGGIYSDLDTITLKSFEALLDDGKSGFGDMYEGFESIGVGVLVFKPNNSEYIKHVVDKFAKNYKPNKWAANGPELFSIAAKEYCNIDDIHYHLLPGYLPPLKTKNTTIAAQRLTPAYENNTHKCANLRIFPQHYFYPFLYYKDEYKKLFAKDSKNNERLKIAVLNSYSMHYFGKKSSENQARPGDNSFFSSMAEQYCRFTYSYVKEHNLTFYGRH